MCILKWLDFELASTFFTAIVSHSLYNILSPVKNVLATTKVNLNGFDYLCRNDDWHQRADNEEL